MTAASTPTLVPRSRRRWFRFLYQFSLRTMLIATTLAGVGCWWFLRPQTQEEELAGKFLTLRRQVRFEDVQPPAGVDLPGVEGVSVGSWQLRNEQADLLVAGRFDNDQPHGKWTIWHASGRKAAEGDAFRGARTGIWRVWDEQGTLRSVVTYRAVVAPLKPIGLARSPRPLSTGGGFFSVLDAASLLGQMGGGLGGMASQPAPPQHGTHDYVAQRHGPCRAWRASGTLQLEGEYADDRRSGLWTYYDAAGTVAERGRYQADQRDGKWVVKGKTVAYIAGRTQDEHDELLMGFASELASDNTRRQIAAAERLEAIGPAGLQTLHAALASGNPQAKLLALRTLMRLETLPDDLLPQLEPLVKDADSRLATRAMLAIYTLRPGRREELYPRIIEAVERAGSEALEIEVLRIVCEVDSERRPTAFLRLVELLAKETWVYEPILTMKNDPVPLLGQAFSSPDPQVRLYVLLAIERLVERGEGEMESNGSGTMVQRWPIPAQVQPLLERAKADGDPEVRELAETIGVQWLGGGGTGFF